MSQKYTQEYKEMLVRLYESGKPVSEIVEEYGIASQTLYKWIKRFKKPTNTTTEALSLHEIQTMRKEMAKMKEENDILKKALAIFAKK